MKPLRFAVTLLLLAVLGCGPAATDSSSADRDGAGDLGAAGASTQSISIDGSSTVFPVSARMMELYDQKKTGTKITVNLSGTGGGMEKFYRGEIDICDASRKIKASEVEACSDANVEFIELAIAYDGLAIVVSKENTWCDCLTVEQLKKLWTPENPSRKWSDIDPSWPDEEVVLYGPGTDSGTFDYFTEEIVGEAQKIRSDFSPSEDDNVIVTGVSTNKYALGYFGFAYYEENSEKLKLLGVDSGTGCIKPTMETVSKNTYTPLSRPLFIYVRKSSLEKSSTADFVKFYIENAAEASKTVGYVPVKPEIQEVNLKKFTEAIQ